jgi:hypothetical protein
MSVREAVDALAANVSRSGWLRQPKTPFIGRVSETSFRIMRFVRGRDSFNPMLYGRLSPSAHGTRVKVVMTLHPVIWALIVAWSVFLGCDIFGHASFNIGSVAFLLFPWVLAATLFYYNAGRSEDLLRQCLKLPQI